MGRTEVPLSLTGAAGTPNTSGQVHFFGIAARQGGGPAGAVGDRRRGSINRRPGPRSTIEAAQPDRPARAAGDDALVLRQQFGVPQLGRAVVAGGEDPCPVWAESRRPDGTSTALEGHALGLALRVPYLHG